jgi:P-type Cu+ transporter
MDQPLTGKKSSGKINAELLCFHCGSELPAQKFSREDKSFCCEGCVTVYTLLKDKDLCRYYDITRNPGVEAVKPVFKEKFAFLDHPEIRERLIRFTDGKTSLVNFVLPAIHCSSCIWLLEHLYRLSPGINRSVIQFQAREIQIWFQEDLLSLRQLAELLASIGYEPAIEESGFQKDAVAKEDKSLYYRLGVAGFCFGNIMLLSFPEYFSLASSREEGMSLLFRLLNFTLALPVLFYSAVPFISSAWKSIRQKEINLDVPLAAGILAMFFRSTWDLAFDLGPGFMDTLGGLVFFLLIGRWFQRRVYSRFSFDRDYKAYFPLAVTRILDEGRQEILPLARLEPGHRLLIRNQELIPADAMLLKGNAHIDYSFVTGESMPVACAEGEFLYAGGRQTGAGIEIQILRPVSESYLTKLWNHSSFHKNKEEAFATFSHKVSHYFTQAIAVVALLAAGYWLFQGQSQRALDAFTAVLIIACPCALALSSPFALGNALRIMERNRFYVKNIATVEALAAADSLVLDKTGTLTPAGSGEVSWEGITLKEEKELFSALLSQSIHPLSRRAAAWLGGNANWSVQEFQEVSGKGICGEVNGLKLKAGSYAWVTENAAHAPNHSSADTRVWLSLEGALLGSLRFSQQYRPALGRVLSDLRKKLSLGVLSGDGQQEESRLREYFTQSEPLLFRQSPEQKLEYIRQMQVEGHKVIMAGDGLNDAGALKQSDAGIALTEESAGFTPSSDAILEGGNFHLLPRLLAFARRSVQVIHLSFMISILYNITGLFFAVQGTLSPLFAAVLMPVSSVTVVVFTTVMTTWMGRKEGLL